MISPLLELAVRIQYLFAMKKMISCSDLFSSPHIVHTQLYTVRALILDGSNPFLL